MPKAYPPDFRRRALDLVQVARAFGISESRLACWLRIVDRDDGLQTRSTAGSASPVGEAEVWELRRRNRQLEQKNEILRRATAYFARDTLPQ